MSWPTAVSGSITSSAVIRPRQSEARWQRLSHTLTHMSASRTRWQDFRGAISLRTAVLALCLGNAVQWYDFALYGAFATVIGAVFFPAQDPSVVMLAAFATYGIAVIITPVGALIFGRWRIFGDAVLSCYRSFCSWPGRQRPSDSCRVMRLSAVWRLLR